MQTTWTIELAELQLGYGDTVVLQDMNCSIPGGCISVILGGSGCGKSTLLRHLIGLSRPQKGKILLGGYDIFAMPPTEFRKIRRRMGVLFQDGALLGSLTLGENVGLPLKEHTRLSQKMIQEIVLHKLALVGLADFASYYPAELSGGMRKRAGLARAMVTDPPILLCDEPTSGLDPISAAQMDELLLDMKKEFPDMTIISVSHDMASVKNIADHVVVLHNKTIVYNGNLHDLENTQDAYLKQFLARKPMIHTSQAADPQYALSEATQLQMRQALDAWQTKHN